MLLGKSNARTEGVLIMNCKLALLISLLLFGCGNESTTVSDLSIIGGSSVPNDATKQSMFPSTVGIVTPTGGCTGVRIGENTYLSAAHCFVKSGDEESTAKIFASNSYSTLVKITSIRRNSTYSGTASFPQERGTDIAIFSIQFKAESEKKAWDRFVTAASLDYSLPMKGRDVILAGFGCAGKEAMLFLEAPVSCTNSPEFAYMKMANSKIMEMNSHYFTLRGVTNIEGTNGFISNGDSGGPVYSTSGAVIGINSAGNLSAILVSNTIYNAETYHSWVGFDAVRGWIDSALTVDKSKS
ncbi:MAG: trypsin-like serine protease, partial [Proteobacteria bacterium]